MPRRAMPTWEDRIKQSAEPAVRAERDARYRYAAPAIANAVVWCDIRLDGEPPAPPDAFAGQVLALRPDELGQLKGKKDVVVTCFDVIERLDNVAPLIEALESLKHATVLISVLNDGSLAELRSVLPAGHTVANQIALAGSVIGPESDSAPTHFIATWGGAALEEVREVAEVDLVEQRDWVRRQLADLAFYKAAYEELKGEAAKPPPRELPPASS
jgi:hypothetical protein